MNERRPLKTHVTLSALLPIITATIVGIGGCGSSSDAAPAPDLMMQAKDDYWSAFLSADVDGIAVATNQLVAELATHPKDNEAARFAGHGFIIQLAEGWRATKKPAAADARSYFDNGLKYERMAYDVAPDDHTRIIELGHIAAAEGPQSPGQSRKDFDTVLAAYPPYGYIGRAQPYIQKKIDDPDFQIGLESYFRFFETCTGKTIDREHPDVSGMFGPTTDPECTNVGHRPHLVEGSIFSFADGLVKAGKVEAARLVYMTLKQSKDFGEWSYRSEVDQRLNDLNGRAALYRDSDPGNDPAVGISNATCFQCHQR